MIEFLRKLFKLGVAPSHYIVTQVDKKNKAITFDYVTKKELKEINKKRGVK